MIFKLGDACPCFRRPYQAVSKHHTHRRPFPDELEGRCLVVEDGGLHGGKVGVLPQLPVPQARPPDPLEVGVHPAATQRKHPLRGENKTHLSAVDESRHTSAKKTRLFSQVRF